MKILNFGSLNIDRVYEVEHLVRPGETISSKIYKEFAGGKGLNQSIALARAGVEVFHAGKIGPDGTFLKELLADNGVDTAYVFEVDEPTGHAVIQVDRRGENSIILFGGANQTITAKEIQFALKKTMTGDWLLIQNEINNIEGILASASAKGMNVVFNPAPMTSKVLDISFEHIKWLIVNQVEGEMLTGHEDPEEVITTIVSNYPGIAVVLTLGSAGVHYAKGKERLFIPAQRVTPIDTTGAGDTFTGYFLSEIIAGVSVPTAITLANKAAAICVSRRGAATSIPFREELSN